MDIKSIGIFTTKIELDDAFMDDDAVRKEYKGVWVELREPTAEEAMAFQQKGNALEIMEEFIIGSNITNGEEPATPIEVAEALKASSTVYTYIVNEWSKSLPLARKNPEIFEQQQDASSEATE